MNAKSTMNRKIFEWIIDQFKTKGRQESNLFVHQITFASKYSPIKNVAKLHNYKKFKSKSFLGESS